jgi:hypothetical protein
VPGAFASVLATNEPSLGIAAYATVTATNTPTFSGASTAAFAQAAHGAHGGNVADTTFGFGPPGEEVIYTVGGNNYRSYAQIIAAMLAATGGTGPTGTFADVANVTEFTGLVVTILTPGAEYNGWDIIDNGSGWLYVAGFTSGQTLAGGNSPVLTVVSGVNDTFKYGVPGNEAIYTVAPQVCTTLAEVEAAMSAAVHGSGNLSTLLTLTDDGTHIIATSKTVGKAFNGNDFLSGATDFLAASGFVTGQALSSGSDAGLIVHAGVNDTFRFGAPSHEVIYTVSPQTFTTLVEVANGMASATDSHGNHWYSVGSMTNNGSKLFAHALAMGPEYNGWDFLTGATDFLADSGFTNGQALAGGA